MKKYDQLTQEQRYHIAALKKTGLSVTTIAEQVGTHKSTISRELKRNLGGRGYSPKQAQELSDARRSAARKHIKMTLALREKIEVLLYKDWSPDQISGYLAKNEGNSISHERIYQHVLEDKKSEAICTSIFAILVRSEKNDTVLTTNEVKLKIASLLKIDQAL